LLFDSELFQQQFSDFLAVCGALIRYDLKMDPQIVVTSRISYHNVCRQEDLFFTENSGGKAGLTRHGPVRPVLPAWGLLSGHPILAPRDFSQRPPKKIKTSIDGFAAPRLIFLKALNDRDGIIFHKHRAMILESV